MSTIGILRTPTRINSNLVIYGNNLAILHTGNASLFKLLVLLLIVRDNVAQVGLAASDDIVWVAGLEARPIQIRTIPVSPMALDS